MTNNPDELPLEQAQSDFTTELNGLVNHLASGGTCWASGCRLEGLNPETDGDEIYLIGLNRDKLPLGVRHQFDNLLAGLSEFNSLPESKAE
jgi:hypothetical protein